MCSPIDWNVIVVCDGLLIPESIMMFSVWIWALNRLQLSSCKSSSDHTDIGLPPGSTTAWPQTWPFPWQILRQSIFYCQGFPTLVCPGQQRPCVSPKDQWYQICHFSPFPLDLFSQAKCLWGVGAGTCWPHDLLTGILCWWPAGPLCQNPRSVVFYSFSHWCHFEE